MEFTTKQADALKTFMQQAEKRTSLRANANVRALELFRISPVTLDSVSFTRQQNELERQMADIVRKIINLRKLKYMNCLNTNCTPPAISDDGAQLARDIHDDLLDDIMHVFEHDIVKSIHFDLHRNDF